MSDSDDRMRQLWKRYVGVMMFRQRSWEQLNPQEWERAERKRRAMWLRAIAGGEA